MSVLTEQEIQAVLSHYKGLVVTSAARIVDEIPTMDRCDIEQELWIKVVRGLRAHDPDDPRAVERDSYVFSCVYNGVKDLLLWKKPDPDKGRHADLFIEDVAPSGQDVFEGGSVQRDKWELEHGRIETDEAAQALIEDDGLVLPSTLAERERRVLLLLYAGRTQAEAAIYLGLTRDETDHSMRAIRLKMADWKPASPPASSAANGRSRGSRSRRAAASFPSPSAAAA